MTLYDCTTATGRRAGVAAAVDAVRAGRLTVLPTDTVYGIGADAFDPAAVRALLEAKGRGRNMPPPVLVGGPDRLAEIVTRLPPAATALAEEFWPGGLTMIVRHAPGLSWDIGDTDGTVGVRMPADPVALEVLRATGPLAVSSANRHGVPPAETAADAVDQFGDLVAAYLETGRCPGGVPSTVVDLVGDRPRVLRTGAVPPDRLRAVLPGLDWSPSAAG
ncbi:MAG: L-threonylcarbamoyladenylate synthase [Actinocatenispora sp.]